MNSNDAMKKLGTGIPLIVLCWGQPILTGQAAPAPVVDTSNWKCKYCAFEEGYEGELGLGFGYVSENSFKFGEYTGLNEQGVVLIGNAYGRYRGEDAAYVNWSIQDLGLDSRFLGVEGGRQGRYEVFLYYDELPHFISKTADTPYLGIGGDTLTLPPGWVTAGSTAGMTALLPSLHEVELSTQRQRLGIGGALLRPGTPWVTALEYRHDTKEGARAAAGSFFFSSAQLIQPVDYVTDAIDVSAAYNGSTWQAKIAYHGSTFRNENDSLTWANAYTPPVAGADRGQLALPPDNQFHQISVSSGYKVSDRTRVSGEVAIGRMLQNETFLPATLNPNLAVSALPRDSLDGRVDTLNANVRVTSVVTDKLRLKAAYTYNDRDNKTPIAAYEWVTADSFVNAPRTNLPYSFTRSALKLSADYQVRRGTKLGAGIDHERHDRSLQEIKRTTENALWVKASTRVKEYADLTFKYAHADRDASQFQPVPEIVPVENPLLRKYNMADRIRDTFGIRAGIMPQERVSIGANLDYSEADYDESTIGLTDSRELVIGGDVSVLVSEKTSLSAFVSHEQIRSTQVGSQTFSSPDWSARNRDQIDSAGIGIKYRVIEDKLDVGADYVLTRSTGEITVNPGVPTDFPDLTTRLDSVKLYATYRFKEALAWRATYWYERYSSDDWMLEGVEANTIPNLIALGTSSPSYNVNVLMLSLQYAF